MGISKMAKKVLLIHIGMLILILSNAQQLPTINHYFLNTYYINPAYAGISGYTDAMFLYRKQWVGIPGAPETSFFSVDWSILSGIGGLGLQFTNDRNNIISNTSAYGSFAYKVNLSPVQRLYFGISLGAINTSIDFDRIRAQNLTESTLFHYPDQRTLIDINAGIAYQYKAFRVGLSSLQLLQSATSFNNTYDKKGLNYGLVRHFNLLFEYAYDFNDKFRIYPMVLLRSIQGQNIQMDMNVSLFYIKRYWLNASYRLQDALGFTFGFVIDKRFAVGYTYELPSFSRIGSVSNGSHEFMLKFRFTSATGRAKTGYEFTDNSIKYVESENSEEEKAKNAKPLPQKRP